MVFAPASLDKSADNYIVKPGNTKYANAFGTGPFNFPAKEKGIFGLGAEDIVIQAGADGADEQRISVMRFCMSSKMLFGEEGINLREIQSARNALEKIDTASDRVSSVRSYYGGIQNRLEHTVSNLDNIVENTQSAESQIRDADMASEVVNKARLDILSQAGMSMMSQANQSTQGVLSLLQ